MSNEILKNTSEIEAASKNMETKEIESLNKSFDEILLRMMRFKSEVSAVTVNFLRNRLSF